MDSARADMLAARHRLATQGWIARDAETFRHLPPPPLDAWLGDDAAAASTAATGTAATGTAATGTAVTDCEASPLAGAGWTLHPVGSRHLGGVDARWLDATDAAQRAELFAGVPLPTGTDAAPFAWAHRALCRHGLRVRIGGASGTQAAGDERVWLQLRRLPRTAVEAPLLVLDVADGVQCVLIEVHERDAASCSHAITQNLQVHVQLGRGTALQHVRLVSPGERDQWAHGVQVRVGERASYRQALIASGSGYHLQHTALDLAAREASAQTGGVLFAADAALEQQLRVSHQAAATRSTVEALVLADGSARTVVNAFTGIAAGATQAEVRQRLTGIPTGGRPKIALRPHLEIHHDQVQAAHGATWGALPEDALFYALQRGLSEAQARALVVDGLAHAALERALGDASLLDTLGLPERLAREVTRHLERGAHAAVAGAQAGQTPARTHTEGARHG
ncbi:MAG: SufD family Fe-S cluster assembly protein [Ideonella sp.]|nr:SufD family Fe-S cluster assembly protein [Ideonella sp.]MCC7456485.1 SufD family Fe-S cluster assembly protein [Nitrospira sp.]